MDHPHLHPDPAQPLPPALAISMGDPLGIGPEVILRALAQPSLNPRDIGAACRIHIYGPEWALHRAAQHAGSSLHWQTAKLGDAFDPAAPLVVFEDDRWPDCSSLSPANHAASGEVSFSAVMAAISACKLPPNHPRSTRALCTGPISKKAWHLAGHTQYPGHTELLGQQLGHDDAVMFFLGPRIKLVLATVHIPLALVAQTLTTRAIVHAATLGWQACSSLGITSPRLAVCGLNPHAGEDGLLGSEDSSIIAPAVAQLRAAGINTSGPLSADSLFLDAARPTGSTGARFDLFVAMYHDQGLIPVKLLDRDASVNITLGLSRGSAADPHAQIVRTSPAHGTAFDIAGQNKADPASMRSAIDAALRLMAEPATNITS